MFAVRRTRLGVFISAALAAALCSADAGAAGPAGSEARYLIQQGSFARALVVLSQEEDGSPERDRSFQKAYCLHQLERWPQAAKLYQDLLSAGENASAAADHVLRDYLLLFAADCLFQTQDHAAAEGYLQELAGRAESLLHGEAEELLARLYLSAGRPADAIPIYARLARESSGSEEGTRFRYELAGSYRQAGRTAEALTALEEIITGHPASREALTALEEYRALRDEPLDGEMIYRAGEVFFHQRRYQQAADEWDRFAGEHPRHELASRALFSSARAHFRFGRYRAARERCRRVLAEYPDSDWQTSCHFLLARCDEAAGLSEQAAERYRLFAATYSWSQLADDALQRLAWMAERAGRLAEAEEEYWNLSRRYGTRENASLALWRSALYALHRGDTATARSRLHRLLRRRTGREYDDGAHYWIARTYAADGDRRQADRQMEKVIQRSGEGYYADRASAWLQRESRAGDEGPDQLADLLAGMMESSSGELSGRLRLRLSKGRELVRLGLLSRARQELREVHLSAHRHPAVVGDLLRLYEDHQLPGDALRLAARLQTRWPGQRVRQALRYHLYPRGYAELVEAEAESTVTDPYLLLALMRTESMFDPLARSPAGARGLMQIMPATGREIAGRVGAPGGDETALFDPRWSIRMGAYYLGEQLRTYGGRVHFALAAYNAGPGNTDRWLRRLGDIDEELFAELIDFRETREYIKKVLTAWVRYRKVWGHGG